MLSDLGSQFNIRSSQSERIIIVVVLVQIYPQRATDDTLSVFERSLPDSAYRWSNGESASYVTCFEFEASSMTLDLTNNHYDIRNTLYDDNDETVVKDYDFLIVSEFGSNPR